MKPSLIKFIQVFSCLIIVSCNVYTPLNTNGTDTDKLEEAQVCLKDSNWDCALEQYNQLKDNTLKEEKLCQVYLSRGGITLSVLVNILNEDTDKLLLNLGNELLPWNRDKSRDLDLAKTHCSNFRSLSNSADAVFLKTTSLLAHCAIRLARTDRFQAIPSDDTCTLDNISSHNGILGANDVCQSNDGSLGGAGAEKPGMCSQDVDVCAQDIIAVKDVQTELSDLGFSELGGAAGKLPSDIVSNVPTNTARLALKGMFRR